MEPTEEEYEVWRLLVAQREAKIKFFATLGRELAQLDDLITSIEERHPDITQYRLPKWLRDDIETTKMQGSISHI